MPRNWEKNHQLRRQVQAAPMLTKLTQLAHSNICPATQLAGHWAPRALGPGTVHAASCLARSM